MSIHLATTPTRKLLLQELERLLGPLNPDVAAEWETKYLLQRRDGELLDQQRRSQPQPLSSPAAQPALSPPLLPSLKAAVETVKRGSQTATIGNGHHREQSNSDTKTETGRSRGKRKRGEEDAAQRSGGSSAESPPSPSPSPSAAAASKVVPPLSQPFTAHNGLEEIAIDDADEPAPPQPSPPSSSISPAPPSTLQLLSVLTFLLPERDPSFYSSWPSIPVTQRIMDAYHSALSSHLSSAPNPLTPPWLFTLAHLLSPHPPPLPSPSPHLGRPPHSTPPPLPRTPHPRWHRARRPRRRRWHRRSSTGTERGPQSEGSHWTGGGR